MKLSITFPCLFLLLFVASPFALQAQKAPNIEQVYLHTDRHEYALGERLWYKAYLVYGYTHALFDHSRLLYVELVSPQRRIVVRHVTPMHLGLGHGDMALADSVGIEAGTYQLRAYTQWMRNFGDDFIFTKAIKITNLRDRGTRPETQGAEGKSVAQELTASSSPKYMVQFFPEGGSMIANVSCRVAFLSKKANGSPCQLVGKVVNARGVTVAELKTKHAGMGSFVMTPLAGESYTAYLMNEANQMVTVPLPEAQKEGYALALVSHKGRLIVSVKTNEATFKKHEGSLLSIRCATRGIIYLEHKQALKETRQTFVLLTKDLPEGIAVMTLLDGEGRPHSERLFYVDKRNRVQLSVSPNKTQYAPREKVTLTLSLSAATPVERRVGSFSMACTDAGIPGSTLPEDMTICSYFLMQADIRGQVYEPGYYFNPANKDRWKYLDLLLLTQGWRDFLWKRLPKPKDDTLRYPVEKRIDLSGRLRRLFVDKPLANTQINMLLLPEKGNFTMETVRTDAQGRFQFDDLTFVGDAQLVLSTQNKNGKKKGYLLVDSVYQMPPVPNDWVGSAIVDPYAPNEFQRSMLKKHITYQVPLGIDDQLLKEVVVKGKKDDEKARRTILFGGLGQSYEVSKDDFSFADIFQLLEFKIPFLVTNMTPDGDAVFFPEGKPLIVVDGVPLETEFLNSINPADVDRIEVARRMTGAAAFGPQAANGVIAIWLKTGENLSANTKEVFHSVNQKVQGYYDARIFYSPNYDEPQPEANQADIRNTLYWNPDVVLSQTDSVKQVVYYNSDVKTEVSVMVEGITASGIPLVARARYTVKK